MSNHRTYFYILYLTRTKIFIDWVQAVYLIEGWRYQHGIVLWLSLIVVPTLIKESIYRFLLKRNLFIFILCMDKVRLEVFVQNFSSLVHEVLWVFFWRKEIDELIWVLGCLLVEGNDLLASLVLLSFSKNFCFSLVYFFMNDRVLVDLWIIWWCVPADQSLVFLLEVFHEGILLIDVFTEESLLGKPTRDALTQVIKTLIWVQGKFFFQIYGFWCKVV